MLTGNGFKEVYNLKDGMMAWEILEAPEASGSVDMSIPFSKGNETISKSVIMALEMEKVLEEFYSALVASTVDAEVVSVLIELAEKEKDHKQRLLGLYQKLNEKTVTRQTFEKSLAIDEKKRDFTTGDFVDKIAPSIEFEEDAFFGTGAET